MVIQTLIDIVSKTLAAYALLLILAAVVLNPLVCYVCLKSEKLRKTSTFKLLAFASINDMLSCLVWNEGDFAHTFFGVTWSKYSPFYCMWISIFFQYTTLQIASWMLVTVSFDRLMSMSFSIWSRHCFNASKPFIFSSILVVVIVGINLNEGFTSGYYHHIKNTSTLVFVCYSNPANSFPWYDTMSQVLVYFGEFLPFTLLIVFNTIIILKANRFNREHRNSISGSRRAGVRRKAQMTRMIVFITFLFIVVTIPSTLLSGYFYTRVITLPEGQLIVNLFNAIQFSYSAFNFFILCFSNKLFAREVNIWLLGKPKNLSSRRATINTTLKTAVNDSRKSFRFLGF